MKRNIFKSIILSCICFMFITCTIEPDWSDPLDNIPPGSISDPIVENYHGGSRITYSLPSDKDLLGVKAIYSVNEDEKELEVFSSAYNDTIQLNGFPDVRKRTVQLISVDKSKNESEPVEVIIEPLTPPVELIRQSLIAKSDFGGVAIRWDNEFEENIGISLYAADSTGEMVYDHTLYSNEKEGFYAFRGYDANERKFQVQIRDRWGNFSIPLDTVLTPMFEEMIKAMDDNGYTFWTRYGFDDGTVAWRGDITMDRFSSSPFSKIYDGDRHGDTGRWHPGAPGVVLGHFLPDEDPQLNHQLKPFYWTLDLGRECILNRHIHYYPGGQESNGNRYYEIWATNDIPKNKDDFETQLESLSYWTSWPEVEGTDEWKNDWVKIATCDFVMPSGATSQSGITEDDISWIKNNGFEFMIDNEFNSQPFRYIRFECQPTYGATTINRIGEIEFYGQNVE